MKFENDKEDTNVCKAIEDMKKEAVEEALKEAEEEKTKELKKAEEEKAALKEANAAALKKAEEEKAAALKEAEVALKEATAAGKNKSIQQMLSRGRTPEAIADFCGYDVEEVRKVAENMSAPA
jgi:hypothetical protein